MPPGVLAGGVSGTGAVLPRPSDRASAGRCPAAISDRSRLEFRRYQARELRPFALGERDVPDDALALEPLDQVREAVARAVEVGVVNLGSVAGQDELGPLADTAGDGFHLVRREVLRFVHDHELVRDRSAASCSE